MRTGIKRLYRSIRSIIINKIKKKRLNHMPLGIAGNKPLQGSMKDHPLKEWMLITVKKKHNLVE